MNTKFKQIIKDPTSICSTCNLTVYTAEFNLDSEQCLECHDDTPFEECGCERCYDLGGPFRNYDEDYGKDR